MLNMTRDSIIERLRAMDRETSPSELNADEYGRVQ